MSPQKIQLAPGLELPADVVTQVIGILARRGRGKTYTAAVLVEQLVKRGLPVVVLDPTGAWFGLRTSADGRRPGLPVTIVGGHQGDVPLEPTAGKVIADLVVDHPGAYVIDLSAIESKKGEQRFSADFLEQLYRAKAGPSKRDAMLLVVDEADFFAPQNPGPEQARTLGALESIVRRGRIRGLGALFITQRSAVLNKNILSQIEVLVALQTTDPRDRAAIDLWVKGNGTAEERDAVMGSLASLEIGEAWVWSPTWLKLLKRVRIQKRETFDSGKTPTPGAEVVAPTARAKVDLGELTKRIKDTVEQAKANDPAELRRRIAALEQELAKARKDAPAPRTERVEVPVLKDGQVTALERLVKRLEEVAVRVGEPAGVLAAAVRSARTPSTMTTATSTGGSAGALRFERKRISGTLPPVLADPGLAVGGPVHSVRLRETKSDSSTHSSLGAGEAKILAAIAQRRNGATRELLTITTGYKKTSRDTYLQRLQQAGLVEKGGLGIIATSAGIAALGERYEPLPTGNALIGWWCERLSGGEGAIFRILVNAYPSAVTRDSISDETGYKKTSRDTYLQRLVQRRLAVSAAGSVRLNPEIFE